MEVTDLWSTAPRAVAAALGIGFILKFLKWLLEFTFLRLDVNRGALGQRLQHVEAELDAYREATMLMIGVVAKIDPDNPALAAVARMLRMSAPRPTMDLDTLARKLSEIPGSEGAAV